MNIEKRSRLRSSFQPTRDPNTQNVLNAPDELFMYILTAAARHWHTPNKTHILYTQKQEAGMLRGKGNLITSFICAACVLSFVFATVVAA
jgi:hypothetical protein